MINISKEDTYKLIYNNQKILNNVNRFSFTTKFPIKCLGCLTELYVNYEAVGLRTIFCTECNHKSNYPNIVAFQYIRTIKEKQLKLIDKFSNFEMIENDIDSINVETL